MNRFSLIAAAVAAALSLSSASFAAPAAPVLADCSKVTKKVVRVCKTYNAHKQALENTRDQLHEDELSIKAIRAHILDVEGIFKAIRANKTKKDVRGKIAKLNRSSKAVMKQVKPLAKKYPNYMELLKDMEYTKERFETAFDQWLKGKSTDSDKVDCKKVKKDVRAVCKTYKAHRKALKATRKQLESDELTGRFVTEHIKALAGVYKAVAANKTVKKVAAKEKVLEKTSRDVMKQVNPLARQYENYADLLKDMKSTKSKFEKALKKWKKNKTSDDDDDDDSDDDEWDDL